MQIQLSLVWLGVRLGGRTERDHPSSRIHPHPQYSPKERALNFTTCFFKKVNASDTNSHAYPGLNYFNPIAFLTAEISLHLGREIGGEKEGSFGTRCNLGKHGTIIALVTKLTHMYEWPAVPRADSSLRLSLAQLLPLEGVAGGGGCHRQRLPQVERLWPVTTPRTENPDLSTRSGLLQQHSGEEPRAHSDHEHIG